VIVLDELQLLADSKDVRSADRAVIRKLLRKLQKGEQLDYQERQNLWAYLMRYHDRVQQAQGRSGH
jgi:hypothetical protein